MRNRVWNFIGGGAIIALVLTLLFPTIQQWIVGGDVCATSPHFFALDEGKESPGAFGPAVKEGTVEEIQQELHDRRCQDPFLVSSHEYAHGLISLKQVNSRGAQLLGDPDAWRGAIDRLEEIEAKAAVSIDKVAKGLPSLYMAPYEDVVAVYPGATTHSGMALVFVTADAVVKLRLECGFQPVFPPGPPPPPPPPPPTNEPKGDSPQPPGKPKAPETPVSEEPEVITEIEGPGGVVDTPANPPGSETGGDAPDSTPVTKDDRKDVPLNEGGNNDGTVGADD